MERPRPAVHRVRMRALGALSWPGFVGYCPQSAQAGHMPLRSGPIRERATLADRLLHATTPEQVVDVLLESHPDMAAAGACVLWSGNWPASIQSYPQPY